jgi:hypothetical protein
MTMIEEMAENQKYIPDFGYTAPKKTRKKCSNPAFMDHNLHRVGYFKSKFQEDCSTGYSAIAKCVNCGREFEDDIVFIPMRKGNK